MHKIALAVLIVVVLFSVAVACVYQYNAMQDADEKTIQSLTVEIKNVVEEAMEKLEARAQHAEVVAAEADERSQELIVKLFNANLRITLMNKEMIRMKNDFSTCILAIDLLTNDLEGLKSKTPPLQEVPQSK